MAGTTHRGLAPSQVLPQGSGRHRQLRWSHFRLGLRRGHVSFVCISKKGCPSHPRLSSLLGVAILASF
eukprot:scaffold88956_cov18-Phaeocystis_antarctica.AAC.1